MVDEAVTPVSRARAVGESSVLASAAVGGLELLGAAMGPTPWGFGGRVAAAAFVGAVAGGMAAAAQGEQDGVRILGAAAEAGIGAGMAAATLGAFGAPVARMLAPLEGAAKATAATALGMIGTGVGTALAELCGAAGPSGSAAARGNHAAAVSPATLPAPAKPVAPATPAILPTITLGVKQLSGDLFGLPGQSPGEPDTPSLFASQTLPEFPYSGPQHMVFIRCPHMKGHTPDGKPYPPEYYISGPTEYIHAVTAPAFLAQCYRTFGDPTVPAKLPNDLDPLGKVPNKGLPDSNAALIERYSQVRASLARAMINFRVSHQNLLNMVNNYRSLRTYRQWGTDDVDLICTLISDRASRPVRFPGYSAQSPGAGAQDCYVLSYLEHAIRDGRSAVENHLTIARRYADAVDQNTKNIKLGSGDATPQSTRTAGTKPGPQPPDVPGGFEQVAAPLVGASAA